MPFESAMPRWPIFFQIGKKKYSDFIIINIGWYLYFFQNEEYCIAYFSTLLTTGQIQVIKGRGDHKIQKAKSSDDAW